MNEHETLDFDRGTSSLKITQATFTVNSEEPQ
jgi:hypothetical protein